MRQNVSAHQQKGTMTIMTTIADHRIRSKSVVKNHINIKNIPPKLVYCFAIQVVKEDAKNKRK